MNKKNKFLFAAMAVLRLLAQRCIAIALFISEIHNFEQFSDIFRKTYRVQKCSSFLCGK